MDDWQAVCPFCRDHIEVSRHPWTGELPTPGDVILCASCSRLSVVAEGNNLRPPTPKDTVDMVVDPDFAGQYDAAIEAIKKKTSRADRQATWERLLKEQKPGEEGNT